MKIYSLANILQPGPNRSRRRRSWRAWLAAAVLLVGLFLAIFGGAL